MKTDFSNDFADFLEERLGRALFALREGSEEYRNLSDEYEVLLNGEYTSVDEYRQAVERIAAIGKRLDDIVKHYIFIAGMRERARIEDALLSEQFEKFFTDEK